jgi:hypothetical protein
MGHSQQTKISASIILINNLQILTASRALHLPPAHATFKPKMKTRARSLLNTGHPASALMPQRQNRAEQARFQKKVVFSKRTQAAAPAKNKIQRNEPGNVLKTNASASIMKSTRAHSLAQDPGFQALPNPSPTPRTLIEI